MIDENKKDDQPAAREASLSAPICSLEFLTAGWLYRALRPAMSYEITANKEFWEEEARKLRQALSRQSDEANGAYQPCRGESPKS